MYKFVVHHHVDNKCSIFQNSCVQSFRLPEMFTAAEPVFSLPYFSNRNKKVLQGERKRAYRPPCSKSLVRWGGEIPWLGLGTLGYPL